MIGCDICGRELTNKESKQWDRFNEDEPCYCRIIKKVSELKKENIKLKKLLKEADKIKFLK